MEENRFFVAGDRKIYLKVPNNFEGKEIMVQLALPQNLHGKYLKLEVVPEEVSDIPVKCRCQEEMCENCGVVHCMVHYGNAVLYDVRDPLFQVEADDRPTIPGHPNCHYGECDDCKVVSCAIQQGWIPVPELT